MRLYSFPGCDFLSFRYVQISGGLWEFRRVEPELGIFLMNEQGFLSAQPPSEAASGLAEMAVQQACRRVGRQT
jgi:hypothetical protein